MSDATGSCACAMVIGLERHAPKEMIRALACDPCFNLDRPLRYILYGSDATIHLLCPGKMQKVA